MKIPIILDDDEFDEAIKVKKQIGEGAYGKVYMGTFKGTPVALKVFTDYHPKHGMGASTIRELSIMKMIWEMVDPTDERLNFIVKPLCLAPWPYDPNEGADKDGDEDDDSDEDEDDDDHSSCDTTTMKTMCLVMEYLNGGEVSCAFRPGSPTMARLAYSAERRAFAYTFLRQMAMALSLCHERGIIHRDLSRRNIIFDGSSQFKLCDFGLARYSATLVRSFWAEYHRFRDRAQAGWSQRPESEKTSVAYMEFIRPGWCLTRNALRPNSAAANNLHSAGDLQIPLSREVTTIWYRAPEVEFNKGRYNAAIDVWAMGVMFTELLIGRTLFQVSTDEEFVEAMTQTFFIAGHSKPNQHPTGILGRIMRLTECEDLSTILTETDQDLILTMLDPDVRHRVSIIELLHHPALQPSTDMIHIEIPVEQQKTSKNGKRVKAKI